MATRAVHLATVYTLQQYVTHSSHYSLHALQVVVVVDLLRVTVEVVEVEVTEVRHSVAIYYPFFYDHHVRIKACCSRWRRERRALLCRGDTRASLSDTLAPSQACKRIQMLCR